jgi:hypothetical protein
MLGAAQHTVGAGEGPDGAPSNASAYPYSGNLVGVQWVSGDVTASTQIALTGGASPSSGDIVATAAAGATSYETGSTSQGFWWVRHAKNGQFSAWVVALFTGGGGDPEPGEELFPEITSVTQTTNPDSCSVGSPVNLRIQMVSAGSSLMTLQRSVNGGAFATVDSGVTAGTTVINRSETSGSGYRYQVKYNDVSPETYSPASSSTSAVCNLL